MEKKWTIKKIVKCMFCSIFMFFYILYTMLLKFITGTIGIKFLIGGVVTVITLIFLFVRPLFYVFLLIYALLAYYATYLAMEKDEDKERDGFSYGHLHNIFAGMNETDAKKKYYELMKEYHPDNAAGSVRMAQKIAADYSDYKAQNG